MKHRSMMMTGAAPFNLLKGAIAHFSLPSIVGSNPVTAWNNIGTGGSAYDLDTVVGTAANLITLESGVALLTGTAGDYFSTPDSAAASITGDIDFRINFSIMDSTSIIQGLIHKWAAVGNLSYSMEIDTTGTPRVFISVDGTATILYAATVDPPFADGTRYHLRFTRVSSTGLGKFYTSINGTTWTQLGDDISTTSGAIFDSNSAVHVGIHGNGIANPLTGRVYRVQIFNGIDGTLAVDFDPSKATVNTATFVTDTGETWTAQGDAFVNATDYAGIYSRGSVGLETTTGQTISAPLTIFIVAKYTLAAPGADQFLFDSKETAGESIRVFSDETNSDKMTFDAGGTPIALSEAFDSDLHVLTIQHNKDGTTKLTISDVGSVTGDAGTEDFDFASLFKTLSDNLQIIGIVFEFLVFNSALNATRVTRIQNHLERKYGT